MIFKSLVFSQASGSTGGLVYSRNQGGMYVRARAKPTNPNSEAQSAVRDAMRTAVFAWSNVLTATQRENWNTYAFNTPTWNRLGEATSKTGQQMYIRGQIPALQAGLTLSGDAPTAFDLGDFTPLVPPVVSAAGQDVDIAFTNGDEWANELQGALLVYMSRPQNPTRNYGKGPYQLLTAVLGSSLTPPTSPDTAAVLFPVALGQKIFFKINALRADGRFTMPQYVSSIVGA